MTGTIHTLFYLTSVTSHLASLAKFINFNMQYLLGMEPGVAQWLRRCTTSRMVPGSIPDGVTWDFFHGSFWQNHVPWGRLSLWKWVPGISPGAKAARAYSQWPTTLVVPNVETIRGLNLPGTPRTTSACHRTPLLFYLLGIMHILQLKENTSNISSKMVNKTVTVTITDLTKLHGPHQMANWNTSEHWTASHHSKLCESEWCHTNQFATPPFVIHIFWPFMMYSSPFFSARVFTPLTSDPAPGSVTQ